MNRMIALWAHPRSRSTALERVFIERKDFAVFHEPFAKTAFDADSDIPSDNLDDGMPCTYSAVKEHLRAARKEQHVMHKDMCYHCLDSLLADPEFLLEQTNVFLVREPVASILSHHKIFPDMPREAIGHHALYEVFCYVTKLTGKIPYVINTDALMQDPATGMARLFEHLELPFSADSLRWAPGCPDQWKTWRSWHASVESSHGLSAMPVQPLGRSSLEHDERLLGYHDFHQPFYERLNQFTS